MRAVTPTQPDDDDDVKIEVVPSRNPIPEPDRGIESGEIVDRRSLVIRSSTPIPALLPDEHTERTRQAAATAPPPRTRSWIGWLVATIVPAGVAVVLRFAETSSPPQAVDATIPIQPTAELIGTTFDAQARAALMRAEAVATSPMVRNGIETDAATLADMAKEQPAQFPVEHGETIEVFQVRDGAHTPLLRVPADAAAVAGPPAGQVKIERRDQGVVMIATAAVAPNGGLGGEIVMSIPIELGPIQQRIDPRSHAVSLNGLDAPIALVTSPTQFKGVSVSLPVRTTVDLHAPGPLSVSAVVAVPPVAKGNSAIRAARIASISLAGVMALVLVVTLVRRRTA